MGYRAQRKTYRLRFEEPEFEGLVVRATGMTMGETMRISKWRSAEDEDMEGAFRLFADKILDWNLEDDDGAPVPATFEALQEQDVDFVMHVIDSYMEAVMSVPTPLGNRSTSGGTSLAASLPMEPLSESQAS